MTDKPKLKSKTQPEELETEVAVDEVTPLGDILANALKFQEETSKMNESKMNTADNHSNPDPRKNYYRSTTASDNMRLRLEAEAAIIKAEIAEIDRRIAELQAERTDKMEAYSYASAGITKAEQRDQ